MKEEKVKKVEVIKILFSIYEKGLKKENCNIIKSYKEITKTLSHDEQKTI